MSNNNPDSWTWNFGDGTAPLVYTESQNMFTHDYASPGTYHVTLTVSNDYGTDTVEIDVVVP